MIRFTYRSIKTIFFNHYVLITFVLTIVFFAGIFTNNKVFVPDLHRLYMESMMVNDVMDTLGSTAL